MQAIVGPDDSDGPSCVLLKTCLRAFLGLQLWALVIDEVALCRKAGPRLLGLSTEEHAAQPGAPASSPWTWWGKLSASAPKRNSPKLSGESFKIDLHIITELSGESFKVELTHTQELFSRPIE